MASLLLVWGDKLSIPSKENKKSALVEKITNNVPNGHLCCGRLKLIHYGHLKAKLSMCEVVKGQLKER